MTPSSATPVVRARKLYALALALDLIGLTFILLQAGYGLATPPSSKGVLILIACAPLLALLVLVVMPSRVSLQAEADIPRRSPVVWVNLALPVVLGGLTLLLVGLSGRFDDFAGFALFLAIIAGYHLRECLRPRGLSVR